jgi:hypothetical protein
VRYAERNGIRPPLDTFVNVDCMVNRGVDSCRIRNGSRAALARTIDYSALTAPSICSYRDAVLLTATTRYTSGRSSSVYRATVILSASLMLKANRRDRFKRRTEKLKSKRDHERFVIPPQSERWGGMMCRTPGPVADHKESSFNEAESGHRSLKQFASFSIACHRGRPHTGKTRRYRLRQD